VTAALLNRAPLLKLRERRYAHQVAGQTLAIQLLLNGLPVRSETLLEADGAYTIALSTTLPNQAIALHSTYLGSAHSPHTAISHLLLTNGAAATELGEQDTATLPVDHSRQHCLYHHLHRLQDLAAELELGQLSAPSVDAAATALAVG